MSARVPQAHYSIEFHETEDGWWSGKCACGYQVGCFPDADLLCDALMQNAYEQGLLDGRQA